VRRRWKVLVGVVAILAVGGLALWYFVLRDTAAPEASLDAIDGNAAAGDGPATPDGTWTVEPGDTVFVGYRVEEQFAGETLRKTATGRTPEVDGTLTIEGSTVSAVDITADLTGLTSDQQRRDSSLATRGIETGTFPTATFTLTSPLELPDAPRGEPVDTTVAGNLTLHGVTAPVEVAVQAKWDGPTISVAGSAPISFDDFGIQAIEIPGFVSTAGEGTMELQLLFVPS
jgi:polyisoprenoid-binding protein YceI